MLVYALLTSVVINSALCVVFFVLHSKLRKNRSHYDVYIPRLLAQGSSRRKKRVCLETIVPSSGWISKAWKLSEEELLVSSGLDAVVFMRLITLSLKIFCFAGIIGIFVILPVNCLGNQLADFDLVDWSLYSLDVFTISNVNNGSERLWIHFAAVYAITVFVCILLYIEYRYIAKRRLAYFYSSKPQPHEFTILVHSIPTPGGTSISDNVESFFKEYHPSTYLSHSVIRHTRKIKVLAIEAKKLYRMIAQLWSSSGQQKSKRSSCFGLFGSKTDRVDDYEKRLINIEENVREEHSLAGKEVRAAFVSFKSRYGAAMALHMQQSENPTHWIAEKAPAPHDVYWPFFSASFIQRWISKLVIMFIYILFTIVFLIPVVFAQGLTNLKQLEVWFPFLRFIFTMSFVSQIITGYLPNLILQLFLRPVPPLMEFLASIQGYISHTDIEKSASNKVLWLMIWNVFLATVLSGSALYQVSIVLELRDIPSKLADGVPAQASFFIAYVVTSGWTTVSSEELFRVMPFIGSLIRKYLKGIKETEFEVPSLRYHRDIPRILFFGLLGITYFFLAPLILPFLLVYLCMAYIIYKNQFMTVYEPKYESGGKFWPVVHDSVILSLIIMHLIALGIFTVKKLPSASSFIFPLPILTLIFNHYCRQRFLPTFHAYSAETLIKKDKEDQKDPSMAEFYNKLVTAYNQDPALLPMRFSNSDSLSSPLISSEIQA